MQIIPFATAVTAGVAILVVAAGMEGGPSALAVATLVPPTDTATHQAFLPQLASDAHKEDPVSTPTATSTASATATTTSTATSTTTSTATSTPTLITITPTNTATATKTPTAVVTLAPYPLPACYTPGVDACNCGDFNSAKHAKWFHENYDLPDINNLDGDDDGVICENHAYAA